MRVLFLLNYLIKFIFYTSGVIGLLLIAFMIAKSSLNINPAMRKKTGKLEIEESLAISPRKTLHIVKALNEKFLIASDATSTTFLAKLNSDNEIDENYSDNFQEYLEEKPANNVQQYQEAGSVIKSMLNKLNK